MAALSSTAASADVGEERGTVVVSLLDYGAGNVRSVRNAIKASGYATVDVLTPEDIEKAEVIVFPGVGSFGSAMETLNDKGFTGPLTEYIKQDRAFFGICLGMQTLFDGSEETPGLKGLGVIPGMVASFDPAKTAVPHIGWNGLCVKKEHPFVDAFDTDGDAVYFVHSFRATSTPENEEWVLSTTTYGGGAGEPPEHFISSVQKGNVTACQFHPEKSGKVGLRLLGAFLDSVGKAGGVSGEGNGDSNSGGGSVRGNEDTKLVKRIVACLDVRSNDQGDLVVTKGDQYDVREAGTQEGRGDVRNLGKPVELSGRYYEEGADEVCFLNITSFRQGVLDDLPMLKVLELASERVFVPLTVGGGIRSHTDDSGKTYSAVEVASRYFRAGADKISLGSDAVYAAEALLKRGGELTGDSSIEQISHVYGKQAVVVSVDPRRVYVANPEDAPKHTVLKIKDSDKGGPMGQRYCWYQCTVKGGREGKDIDAVSLAKSCETLGAGEILLNCVDMDGQKDGFDLELVKAVMRAVSIPVIASSGAGAVEHFSEVFEATGVQAALAAGIFHRKEVSISEVKDHLAEKGVPARRAA
ncbi:unnamed protein product [Ectocarpus sp. CCAP 1310/34]|nr:unnamed protein product [Ectocarpus sp. CCAP 1310/34]